MLYTNLGDGIEVPTCILDGFNKSLSKILACIHEDEDRKLSIRELRTTRYDLKLISQIISQNSFSADGEGKFLIIDEFGNVIYKSNGCNLKFTIDENGYFNFIGNEFTVHPFANGFVSGITKEHADKNYKRCVENGFFYPDPSFGENGFTRGIKTK